MKYVAIIFSNGIATVAWYAASMIGNVVDDLTKDENVITFRPGFKTEDEAKRWLQENS